MLSDQPKPPSSSNLLHYLILLLYGIFLTVPAWSSGYIPGRDTMTHLLWSSNFADQFWVGDLYPRWLTNMNSGLGSPVFFFYAPLPYYITALLRPLHDLAVVAGITSADPQGWHQLGLSSAFAVILSGFAVYAWVSTFSTKTAALLAAIFYMCAPFHLAIDLYQRFGFGELWAFVWLPLLLFGAQRLCKGHRDAPFVFTIFYAALLLTHLPTTLIFSLVLIAYPAWFSAKDLRLQNTVRIILAMALGVGLAAIYLVPALTTQDYVSFAEMRKYYMHYSDNFLYWGPRFNIDMEIFVGFLTDIATLMMLCCCCAYFFIHRNKDALIVHHAKFWLLLSVATVFMMLPLSKPLWDHLNLLQRIQFPWRFHVVLTLAATAMFALWIQSLERDVARWTGLPIVFAGIALAYQFLPTLIGYQAISMTHGKPSLGKMMQQFGTRDEKAKESVSEAMIGMDVPEYRPRWVPYEFVYNAEALRIQVEQTKYERLNDQLEISLKGPRHILLHSTATTSKWVTIEHFYYPGWVAQLIDKPGSAALEVRPSTPEGLLQILVPPGQYDFALTLETSTEEKLGSAISLASLLVLLGLLYREWRPSKSRLPVNA